jgi:hypothetical protein
VRTTAFCTRDETCGHGDDPTFDTASLGAVFDPFLIWLCEDPPDPNSVVTPAFDTASLGAVFDPFLIWLCEDPPDPNSVVTPAFDTACLGAVMDPFLIGFLRIRRIQIQ